MMQSCFMSQPLPQGSRQHPHHRLTHLLFLLFLYSLTSCSNGVTAPTKRESIVPLLGVIPDTPFRCLGHSAGYYADPDTGCQVYHMCDSLERQYSYLCPNYTLFNQKFMVCDHWYMVNCSSSHNFYHLNSHIGEMPDQDEGEEQNAIKEGPADDASPRSKGTPTRTPFPSLGSASARPSSSPSKDTTRPHPASKPSTTQHFKAAVFKAPPKPIRPSTIFSGTTPTAKPSTLLHRQFPPPLTTQSRKQPFSTTPARPQQAFPPSPRESILPVRQPATSLNTHLTPPSTEHIKQPDTHRRQPQTPSTRKPQTPPTRQPHTPPTRQPHTPPTRQAQTPPTRQPHTPPTRQPHTPPTRQPHTPPTRQPQTPPTRQPHTPPTRKPQTPPTRQPQTPSTRQPQTPPTRQPTNPTRQQPLPPPTRQPTTTARQPTTPRQPLTQPTTPRQPLTSPTRQPTTPRQSLTPPTKQPTTPAREPFTPRTRQPITLPTKRPAIPSRLRPLTLPPKQPVTPTTSTPITLFFRQPTRQPINQPSKEVTVAASGVPKLPPSFLTLPTNEFSNGNKENILRGKDHNNAELSSSHTHSTNSSLSSINNLQQKDRPAQTEQPGKGINMIPRSVARSPGNRFSFTSHDEEEFALTPEELQRIVFQPLLARPLIKPRRILTSAPSLLPIDPANSSDPHHHHFPMRIEFPDPVIPEDSSSRISLDLKLSNSQGVQTVPHTLQPPSVSPAVDPISSFLSPPSHPFTPIIGMKQEFPTPLATPQRHHNLRTPPRDTFLPGARRLPFPSSARGNRDFFIPSAEFSELSLVSELPQNIVEVAPPNPSHGEDHHRHHHHHHHHHDDHMTMVFPAPIEPSMMEELKLNPECPRCHPEFLKPGQCHPCVVIK